jgi:hypothetical protein
VSLEEECKHLEFEISELKEARNVNFPEMHPLYNCMAINMINYIRFKLIRD